MMDIRREFDDWQNHEQAMDVMGGSLSAFTFLCIIVLITTLGLVVPYGASGKGARRGDRPRG